MIGLITRLLLRPLRIPSVKEPPWRTAARRWIWRWGRWWSGRWPAEAHATLKRVRFHEAKRYFSADGRRELLEGLGRSISTGASVVDYQLLHRYIVARRPRRILELGSGVTTVIMGDALSEVRRADPSSEPGRIDTLEDVPKYFEDARALCPEALRPMITYHLEPRVVRSFGGYSHTVCYENLPEGPFDLIFVDGPNFDGHCLVDGDLLFLLAKQTDHAADIILDGRKNTAELFLRFLPRGRCAYDPVLKVFMMRGIAGRDVRTRPTGPRRPEHCDAFVFFGV